MALTLKLTMGYEDTDFTRIYTTTIPNSIAAAVKDNIKDINTSLLGGTAGGMESFFISDDGDYLQAIIAAKLIRTDEETITIEPAS